MIFVLQDGEEIGQIEGEDIYTEDVQLDSLFYQLVDEGIPQQRRPGVVSYQEATPERITSFLREQGYEARNGERQTQDCDEEKKLTHKEVKYEDPAKGKDKCNGCQRFSDDDGIYSCQLVQSPVTPRGWCEEFKKRTGSGIGDAEQNNRIRVRGQDSAAVGHRGAAMSDEESTQLEYEDMDFQGLKLNIENLRGSVRHGSTFHQKMTVPYGYIQQTEGADGDAVDCFVGPVLNAPYVYVVHTRNKAGAYDEDKCFLGFESARQAHECFLENYDNPYFFESMEKLSMRNFKLKLRTLSGKKITA